MVIGQWGHKQGAETVEQLLDWCNMLNVKYRYTVHFFHREFSGVNQKK